MDLIIATLRRGWNWGGGGCIGDLQEGVGKHSSQQQVGGGRCSNVGRQSVA